MHYLVFLYRPALCLAICWACTSFVMAQVGGDEFFLAKKKGLLGKLGKTVSCSAGCDAESAGLAVKNSSPFERYRNRYINSITIRNVGFGTSVNDTTNKFQNLLTDMANRLHRPTRPGVVTQNLFFKLGDPLLPELLADNVRYLREQPYLQDANVVVSRNRMDSSLVDVSVFYKDVFSLGANLEIEGKTAFLDLGDENIGGSGQRGHLLAIYDLDRRPRLGLGGEYTKRNFLGGFANLNLGVSDMQGSYSSGRREESLAYARIDLPLASQYFVWTGGAEISYHQGRNFYQTDSLFALTYRYAFHQYDVWAGMKLDGHRSYWKDEVKAVSVKQFIAGRATAREFENIPGKFSNTYSNQFADFRAVLGSYTAFKQDYYRAHHVYGFGRNEDIPKGFNLSALGGWVEKNRIGRAYWGLDLERETFASCGRFIDYRFVSGGYLRYSKLEDVGAQVSMASFSRLKKIGKSRWLHRDFVNAGFARQYGLFFDDKLRLNGGSGLPQFGGDSSTIGTMRLSIIHTSVFYNTRKLAGFSFAPFYVAGFGAVRPYEERSSINGYWDLAIGLRSRNENLVFGTMELRVDYFPRTVGGMSSINIALNTGLQFKYNSQYVKRPEIAGFN